MSSSVPASREVCNRRLPPPPVRRRYSVGPCPQDFAREVLRALEDAALRRRIAAAGRILVEKEYSWEVIGGHLEQAYRCVQNRNACERRAELS